MSDRGSCVKRKRESAAASATVRVHVREEAQLYNALDPSPFWDRDLDRNAAEFIEGEFREHLLAGEWHLDVQAPPGHVDVKTLQTAITTYYDRLVQSARRELNEHLRAARIGTFTGLALFATIIAIRRLLLAAVNDLPLAIDEGLILVAWLMLWRPAETLLYDWIPLHRKRRLYERLRGIRVTVNDEASPPTRSPTA